VELLALVVAVPGLLLLAMVPNVYQHVQMVVHYVVAHVVVMIKFAVMVFVLLA